MSDALTVSIVGGAGYTGGELLRLLAGHGGVRLGQVTSRSRAGEFVHGAHPNLRGVVRERFVHPQELGRSDVLMLCLPHGEAQKEIERYAGLAERVIDLSADFRLRDAGAYRRWYGEEHAAKAWLDRFVYGLAELRRSQLAGAKLVSGVGCNATAMNLALLPLAKAGLIRSVVCDLKVGSSEGGAGESAASHHPLRSGRVRTFAAAGHRHEAEVRQELMEPYGAFELHTTITSVELVRGVLCTAHVFPTRAVSEKELWGLYRGAYGSEPFVRIVKDRGGLHRFPEPRVLAGSNWADVGFEVAESGDRIVALCAIDNLMKGAAGSAVQCMNLMCGFEERRGLEFAGLYP